MKRQAPKSFSCGGLKLIHSVPIVVMTHLARQITA